MASLSLLSIPEDALHGLRNVVYVPPGTVSTGVIPGPSPTRTGEPFEDGFACWVLPDDAGNSGQLDRFARLPPRPYGFEDPSPRTSSEDVAVALDKPFRPRGRPRGSGRPDQPRSKGPPRPVGRPRGSRKTAFTPSVSSESAEEHEQDGNEVVSVDPRLTESDHQPIEELKRGQDGSGIPVKQEIDGHEDCVAGHTEAESKTASQALTEHPILDPCLKPKSHPSSPSHSNQNQLTSCPSSPSASDSHSTIPQEQQKAFSGHSKASFPALGDRFQSVEMFKKACFDAWGLSLDARFRKAPGSDCYTFSCLLGGNCGKCPFKIIVTKDEDNEHDQEWKVVEAELEHENHFSWPVVAAVADVKASPIDLTRRQSRRLLSSQPVRPTTVTASRSRSSLANSSAKFAASPSTTTLKQSQLSDLLANQNGPDSHPKRKLSSGFSGAGGEEASSSAGSSSKSTKKTRNSVSSLPI